MAGAVLAYLIYDINRTERSLAQSLLAKPMQSAEDNLTRFFQPIESSLGTFRDQARLGQYDTIPPSEMNILFAPLIINYPQISSMGIAHDEGYEYDVLPVGGEVRNREVWVDKWGMVEHWSAWELDANKGTIHRTREWNDSLLNDPRERPWYTGALESKKGKIHWTDPYLYITTYEVGMTASVSWMKNNSKQKQVFALDITLEDITRFTQELHVSPNGKVFVLTSDGRYIGLPKDDYLSDSTRLKTTILAHVDSVEIPAVKDAYKKWNSINRRSTSFEFESDGKYWWGKITRFQLTNNESLVVGVVIPEEDILSEVARTKRIVIGGFLFVLVLTGFVLYSYAQSKKANRLLSIKNQEIEYQKLMIQEKSDEILDSINYAKRIQTAILPPDDDFKNWLPNSFVLYKPKDIVAGDFYWLEEKDGWVLFAAADCTGHGVPGAMVSVICKTGLSRSVREYEVLEPGRILNQTRDIVIAQFEKSTEQVKDGMDVALCSLKDRTLKYAGAHNPLWLIRNGIHEASAFGENVKGKVLHSDTHTLLEIKADKQPIGRFQVSKPFTTHMLELQAGDQFYLSSDGFADQFGGERGKKFKASNFKKLLLSVQEKSMKEQREILNDAFEVWKGDLEQLDDVCVIGVRV